MDTRVLDEHVPLKRVIGFWGITFYGLGGIIGAGIFATIGAIAGRAGVWAPFAFVVAGIPAFLAAMSYGELVKRQPKAGGEAAYVQFAFGKLWLTTITAIGVALSGIVSAATLLSAFSGYFQSIYVMAPCIIMLVLAAISIGLAAKGVSLSSGVVVVVTLIEVGLLILISIMGLPDVGHYPALLKEVPFEGIGVGLVASAVLAFFAFVGFEDMVNMAEEVKDAPRILPKALLLAFVISLVLYLLVTITAVQAVSPDILANSHEPLAEVVHAQGVLPDGLMTALALASIGNGVIIQVNMVSRLIYGLTQYGGAPKILGVVSKTTNTPVFAILLTGVLILFFALILPLEQLAELTGVVLLLVFVLVQGALCRILWVEGNKQISHWKHYVVPVLGLISALLLLLGAFA